MAWLREKWNTEADFPFKTDGEAFTKVWALVVGIYPKVSCMVKTIKNPIGKVPQLFGE
jgi:hypothetical protein